MSLKNFGVDVYTAKDGCISPESDDLMGQVMLNFRYAMAQKSSMDTGMRVKDTAQKLVQKGKFMGEKHHMVTNQNYQEILANTDEL